MVIRCIGRGCGEQAARIGSEEADGEDDAGDLREFIVAQREVGKIGAGLGEGQRDA
jgi:hypothetical protein